MKKIDTEGRDHYQEWIRCTRQYLRLQGRMRSVGVLNIGNTANLQKTSDLLALDMQRTNAQLAMTRIQNRLPEILSIQRQIYVECAELVGNSSTIIERQMRWFDAEEQKQREVRTKLAEEMLKHASVRI